jgi:hypothetical protein
VLSLFPTCPVTFRRDIGTGQIVSRDYSNPSYPLTRFQVTRMLGDPNSSNRTAYCYMISQRGANKTLLQIEFRNDLAVESRLYTTAE